MTRQIVNKVIIDNYQEYAEFLTALKFIESPIKVVEHKENHKTSLFLEQAIECKQHFGNVSLSVEIRHEDPNDYSLQFTSDKIAEKHLFRYDT